MDIISDFAESVETKQSHDFKRNTEEFEVVKVGTVNNKFNFTLQNTGNIPVNVTRLWVQNTTDSTWPSSKFNINTAIAPGATITNVGQNIDLIALSTQSYLMKLVTERGSSQKLFLNSVGGESLYLKLHAAPTTVATGFTTTLILEVINTGTSQLLNLQAEMDSVVTSCGATCSFVQVSGPDPTTFSSLNPGDVATFEWIYSLTGDNGDQFTFTASLVNGIDTDSTTVSVQAVQFAENSDVSLTAAGLNIPTIDESILVFHQETFSVPDPDSPSVTYQMYSATPDGGTDGTLVQLDTVLLSSFYTKNGTDTITIPAGKWNASLYLQSEAMTASLINDGEDMIFHFEDGDGVNPDNSESDSARDLQDCGLTVFQERIQATPFDAEQDEDGSMDVSGSSTDFELVYDGGHQWIGLKWELDVPQGATINSADIRFRADENNSTASSDLIIGAEDTDNAGNFTSTSHNVDDRWDGAINTVTDAKVVWNNIPAWSTGEESSDTTTPDLKTIVQEIVDRPSWQSGNGIVFIIKDNSGGSNNNKRTAEHYDAGGPTQAARLTVNHGNTGSPDWQAGTGPHGSGAYYYDGISMCHRSQNNVEDTPGTLPGSTDNTTSLWFRTDGVGQVSSEQMLVFWEGSGTYPNSDSYRISLGEDGTGTLLFEYNLGGTDISTCRSTNEYDDGNWYHVVVVRTGLNDRCDLYITNVTGSDVEPVITSSPNTGSSSVDADGKWYVATAEENGNYFKGWIDDVIHWNDRSLTSTEADDLSKTNYGTGAHQLDVKLDITDSSGTIVSNVYNGLQTPISFQDSKNLGDNNDAGYGIFNITMNLPQVIVSPQQRLNFSMNFVPATATWIPLELDMKIDDDTLSPFPSYLQMPKPDTPFISYFSYDNDFEVDVFVTNSGNDGIYFIYTGTRFNFNGTNGAYAGLIHSVNGTAPAFEVDSTKDSIYIPAGEKAELFFYIPTDQPSTTSAGTIIPPGIYRAAIWLHGYTDQGETFQRSIVLGSVNVVD